MQEPSPITPGLQALQADITTLVVDAIVNAANPALLGGGGVDGAIHRAAGPELLAACRRLDGCPTGEVRVTPGFRLPARFVIHAVGPIWHGGHQREPELLASCYRRAMEAAEAAHCASIAFPAISTGAYGYPAAAAAGIAVSSVRLSLAGCTSLRTVIFCCFSAGDLALYASLLSMPQGESGPMMRAHIGRWLGVELVEVSLAEKIVAMAGGGISILALIALTLWHVPDAGATAIIASMGASAVLLFAVPHGALSQPWPVIVGHTLSAAIGVACAKYIPHTAIAAACAVGLAIGAMHQLKCIHPPGGATALTAVLGSSAIRQLGFGYVLFPVLANAAIMVGLAVLINSLFRWRRYPAAFADTGANQAAARATDPSHEEVLEALRSLDSFVDITEEDLVRLSRILAEHGARAR